jgi:RNA polymerase sigma factor (sigma-70 family)
MRRRGWLWVLGSVLGWGLALSGTAPVRAQGIPVIDVANLAQAVQQVTAWARQYQQMMQQYQQLVRPIALHYHLRCSEPLEDLVQVGLLGLLRAAELYSRQRQTPFDAFARPHIRGAILHYLRDTAPAVRLPRRLEEQHQQLVQLRRRLAQSASPEQLREAMGLSPVPLERKFLSGTFTSLLPDLHFECHQHLL